MTTAPAPARTPATLLTAGDGPPVVHPPVQVRGRRPSRARLRWAVALALVLTTGAVLGTVMPRGPMTTGQSVSALLAAAAVGLLTGRLTGTRWSALVAPVALALAFEAVRLDAVGPTVDAVRVDGVYPVLTQVVGRGFDALVVLLPLAVGALWGERTAHGRRRPGVGLGLATALVVITAVALVRPASTEPVRDATGQAVPGSVAELVTVPIGGHDQSIMLRGHDVDAPVLLFLEGGPGGTAVGAMRHGGGLLEEHFVVATWDQRGTGRSADTLEPTATMTVDAAVRDAVEVAAYLGERFDEDGVYVVGSSWGTTLGVLAVQERPDLIRAYVGVGQMVDQQETDRLMYAQSLAWAGRSDAALASWLREVGPPPWQDPLVYAVALSADPAWSSYLRAPEYDPRTEYPMNLLVAEYTLTEQVRSAAGLIDTFAVLYPDLQDVDLRETAVSLDVPVHVVLGAHEAAGRDVLAREWFAALEAPVKDLVTFETAGHRAHMDDPARFAEYMVDVVLAGSG